MSITKDTIKETIKTIMAEEGDYKAFFKKALEKAGKDIPSMSDEEKKEFFNKIDSAWDGKGEKNEGNAFGAAVTKAKKDGDDEFKVDGKTYKVEESHSDCGCGCGGVTEGGCSTNLPIELSEELTFEINTFLERPVLSKNNNKITVENSELSNLIPTLVKNEIHKRLSSGVKKEFIELLKNYK